MILKKKYLENDDMHLEISRSSENIVTIKNQKKKSDLEVSLLLFTITEIDQLIRCHDEIQSEVKRKGANNVLNLFFKNFFSQQRA
jgi:hypothetical protein